MGEQVRYLAYLLRLWRMNNGEEVFWRAMLEESSTGNRLSFADLPALFSFLCEQTGSSPVEFGPDVDAPGSIRGD